MSISTALPGTDIYIDGSFYLYSRPDCPDQGVKAVLTLVLMAFVILRWLPLILQGTIPAPHRLYQPDYLLLVIISGINTKTAAAFWHHRRAGRGAAAWILVALLATGISDSLDALLLIWMRI